MGQRIKGWASIPCRCQNKGEHGEETEMEQEDESHHADPAGE